MEYPFKDLMPLDEVLEREGYYKDWTHLDPEVFYSLTQISEYIKTKGYGADVRLLIAQLAEHFGLKTTQVVDLANSLSTKHDALKDQFDAVIRDATSGADWGGEIVLARGGKATLGQRLDETAAELAQAATKESLGEVNQDLQTTKQSISDIIATPAGSITEQEIIDARKGKASLGDKVGALDSDIDEHGKRIYDQLYRYGNEYTEKTGGWVEGYKNTETTVTLTKDSDNINLAISYTGGVADGSFVSEELIDITNVNYIYVDWEQTISNAGIRSRFVVSKTKISFYSNGTVLSLSNKFSRVLSKIDVSSLTGLHYIRPHLTSTNSTGSGNLKVYNIYTDEEMAKLTSVNNAIASSKLDIQKQLTSIAYPYISASIEGYWTPEILEKMPLSAVYFRLRDDDQRLHIKPENGAIDLSLSWAEIKTDMASNIITYNDIEYLQISNATAWVVNTTTGAIGVTSRVNIDPENHLILLFNNLGVVVGGEALKWFYSKYKFDNNSLPSGIIKTDHLSSEAIESIGFSIPSDRKTEFDNVVFESSAKPNGKSLSFAFITDTHGEGATFNAMINYLNIVKKLEEYGKLDFVCHGGDIISGYLANKNDSLKNLSEAMKVLNLKTPTMALFGNHDDNSYYKEASSLPTDVIDKQEWRNFVLKQIEDNVIFDSLEPLSKYYFKDFTHQKIRVVCLDSMDYPNIINQDGTLKWAGYNGWGFGFRQINWLAEEALNFEGKEDWQLLVFTHAGFHADVNNPERLFPYNSDHVAGVLKSFKTGTSYTGSNTGDWGGTVTSDFVAQGTRDIIGVFNGHIHTDKLVKPVDLDINLISTTRSQTDRNGAFDIVTINRDDREVFLTRFGDGEDRQFTY